MFIEKDRGFSLVELAITLLIAGLIASAFLSYQQFSNTSNNISTTTNNMKIIQDALTVFLAKNGRLPCPASPSQAQNNATFANEQIVTTSFPYTCNTTNTDINSSSLSGDIIYYGVIPTSSLGLSSEYMFDAWNNRIWYGVQMASVNSVNINTNCVTGNLAQDMHSSSYFCFTSQASGINNSNYQTTNQNASGGVNTLDMEIHQNYLSSSNLISGSPVYVLVSAGPNGYGAYKRFADKNVDGGGALGNNTLRNSASTNANELVNAGCTSAGSCSLSTVGNIFVNNVATTTYDDIVLYKERNQMIMDCNNYTNNECKTTFGMQVS